MGSWNMQKHWDSDLFWCGDGRICAGFPPLCVLYKSTQTLGMEPFMAQGLGSPQKLELIGMISHQGTEKNGHYVAVTKKGEDWILHNDASTTQITPAQLHRSQAYVLIYRKTIPSTETGTKISRADTSQQPTEKLKPTYQGHNCLKKSPPHPDPPKEPYMEQQPQ